MALSFFFISSILATFAYKLYQWLRYKLPPGSYPWPIIGNLHNIGVDRNKSFEKLSEIYGPIISVWFGSELNVIVSNSELAKEVLKDKDHQLANRQRAKTTAVLTKNGKDLVWADYGPHFVKLKKVSSLSLFSSKRIEALRFTRENEVRDMIKGIFRHCSNHNYGRGKTLLLRKYLGVVAVNNVTRLMLGKRFLNDDGGIDEQGQEFIKIVNDLIKLGIAPFSVQFFWWLGWIFRFTNKAFIKKLAHRDQFVRALIEEHKDCQNKQHFVDELLTLQEKREIDEDTMIGLFWDMVNAGMDTPVIVVEWSMAQLVKNPRVRHKVQEELERAIGSDRVMTESDIVNLPYLQCVAKETLRLHPPTPLMLPHMASTNIKLGGYDIPKGTIVHVNVRAIGCDPKMWTDPLEFWPERFMEEDVDMKGNDFRLLPFGAGRRMCPAAQLSINLVTSMIGHLLHHFNWDLPDGVKQEDIDMSEIPAIVNYMRTPLQLVPTVRLPAHLYQPGLI